MAMYCIGAHMVYQIGFMMHHVCIKIFNPFYLTEDQSSIYSYMDLFVLTVYISIYLTVSFTLERYISVCHPLRGQVLCTESRAKKVITGKYYDCIQKYIFDPVFIHQ